jgi:hypothetical protein
MSRLADMTVEQWVGLVGLIVFGSMLMLSIVMRRRGNGPK